MYKYGFVVGCIFVLAVIITGSVPFAPMEKWWFTINFMSNVTILKAVLSVVILFFLANLLFVGFLHQKYSLRVEQLSFGGINIFLNKSDVLFKKSIRNYLDTKRSLFKFDPNYDSFEEVLNSYYECYQFIRGEMKLLDVKKKKDKKLYELSNETLKILNEFLTQYQNNYRRWYKFVSEKDKVQTQDKDSAGEDIYLTFHLTPISTIQSHYYHFTKIIDGFKEVNKFFNVNLVPIFEINTTKWGL